MAENGSRTANLSLSSTLSSPPPLPPARPTIPRVHHRPRLALATPPPPTIVTLQPLGNNPLASSSRRTLLPTTPSTTTSTATATSPTEVTLTAPRPDNDRVVNEYVETPFRPAIDIHATAAKKPGGFELVRGIEGRGSDRTRVRRDPHHQTIHLPIIQHAGGKTRGTTRTSTIVSKQPAATATFKKDLPASSSAGQSNRDGSSASGADCFRGSIICPECGRCRCESCRQPRPLPSRWLCKDTCFCSAETIVDYASCLCCVKGIFYHCSKDYELDRDGDGSCADNPCSCGSHRIYTRWGCLGVLAVALPCLFCYWPLKGCLTLCEKCYARYTNQGCRCELRNPKITDFTTEKRLLDASPDF